MFRQKLTIASFLIFSINAYSRIYNYSCQQKGSRSNILRMSLSEQKLKIYGKFSKKITHDLEFINSSKLTTINKEQTLLYSPHHKKNRHEPPLGMETIHVSIDLLRGGRNLGTEQYGGKLYFEPSLNKYVEFDCLLISRRRI